MSLARRHNISTDPPTATPDKPIPGKPAEVTPRELGRSGGVVEPPPVRDKGVIAPPPDNRSAMPTMPDVGSDQRQAPAADRTTLQAILVAARGEAERGNEAGCREALGRAAKVLERID